MEIKRKSLTLEDKAQRIFDALNKYYEVYPDRQSGPRVTITQDWEVLLNYEGEPCDSDFEDYVTLFINHYEDEEWWYTMDTIKRGIPFVDDGLEKALEFCLDYLGEIPTHENNIPSDVTYFMSMITFHIKQALKNNNPNDWIIEIDMPESDVYLMHKEMRSPGYGGLIRHFEINDFLMDMTDSKKEINFKKVKEISWKLVFDPDSDFGDKDDTGGKLFYNPVSLN
ncbi:MAG: hypothetical protein J1D77_02620 [Muribaculaceae bacterium]|nr:hypothetical protein [Muribaculaceae bacterium]